MEDRGEYSPNTGYQIRVAQDDDDQEETDINVNRNPKIRGTVGFANLETLASRSFEPNHKRQIGIQIGSAEIQESAAPISLAKKKHWGVAPVVSVLTEPTGHRWGFDLGMSADFAFGDILAIESGVSLFVLNADQQYSRRIGSDPQWSSDSFGDRQALDNAANPDNNLADQMAVAYVRDARYIRIPLQLRFFPTKKLQPYLGADRLFLLGSGKNEEAVEVSLTPGFGSISQQESLVLRSENWAWKAGVVFEPGDHLFFDFSYSHGNK